MELRYIYTHEDPVFPFVAPHIFNSSIFSYYWYFFIAFVLNNAYRGAFFDRYQYIENPEKFRRNPVNSQSRHPRQEIEDQSRTALPPAAQLYKLPPDPNAFDRVIGLEEPKKIMKEALNMMLNTEEGKRMKEYGLAPPRGIMLYGPPGTGKTSFARASAQTLGLPFIVVNASSLSSKWVGGTEANINAVFDFAQKIAPCVIFWDEIDAIGKKRDGGDNNSPSQISLNVLLSRMDGFAKPPNVILIAATNRLDVLDPALIRPGRFDCHIHVGLPDKDARKEIVRLYLRNRPSEITEADLEKIAEITEGLSPAELESLVGAAARQAYYDKTAISLEHFTRLLG